MLTDNLRLLNQINVEGIKLDLLSFNFYNRGLISNIGALVALVFTGMLIMWVVIMIRAALKYVRSMGGDQEIEKSTTMIKNVWFGITAFIVFVIALSIGGNIVGYGNVYEWSKNLEQCGGKGFYFTVKEKDVDQLKDTYTTPSTAYVFCCENDGATYERGWKAVDYRQTAEVFTYTAECEKIENISY